MVRPKNLLQPKESHEFCSPLTHISQAGTSACRHALFPAFGGTDKDGLKKRSRLLNPDVSVEEKIFGPLKQEKECSKIGLWVPSLIYQ